MDETSTTRQSGQDLPLGRPPLELHGIGKEYRLYDSPRQRLKALVTGRALHRSQWALRDVSLTLQRGQCLGVIGSNGAGKSTLLKLVTGTLQPTVGQIERTGRITAILELGAGFHPDFTGRENLYFGGSLIGISQEQMSRLEPEVLAFAEIGEAIDRPVKTYSSGMVVRLAFALVTAVQPDLLIIDEALAVGDQYFQKKCIGRIQEFRKRDCTILFCSHSPYHVRQLCDVALWLDQGRVMALGSTEAVIGAYEDFARKPGASPEPGPQDDRGSAPRPEVHATVPTAPVQAPGQAAAIVSVDIAGLDPSGDPPRLTGPDLRVTVTVRGQGQECPNIGFMLEQAAGVGITSLATHEDGAQPRQLESGLWQAVLTFPDLPLHSGRYVISVYLFDSTGLVEYDKWYQFRQFRFATPTPMPGLVRLPHHWS